MKLAHEYHRNPLALLDLVQEGNIGLMQAVKKFDPERGVKLSTLRRLVDPRVHPSLHHGQLEDGEAGDHRGPAKALLQAAPGAGAARSSRASRPPPSCSPSGSTSPSRTWWRWTSGSATTRSPSTRRWARTATAPAASASCPPAAFPRADERLANEELKQLFRGKLEAFGKTLEGKEKYIFEKRLTADEPMTLQDIGTHFGFSPRAGPADRGGAGGPDAQPSSARRCPTSIRSPSRSRRSRRPRPRSRSR